MLKYGICGANQLHCIYNAYTLFHLGLAVILPLLTNGLHMWHYCRMNNCARTQDCMSHVVLCECVAINYVITYLLSPDW